MSGLRPRMQGITKEEKGPGHLNLKPRAALARTPRLMTPRQEAKAPLSLPARPSEHAENGELCAVFFLRQPASSSSPLPWPGIPRRGLPSIVPRCAAPASQPATTGKRPRPGSRPAPTAARFKLAGTPSSSAALAIKPSATTAFSPATTDAMPWRQFQLLPPSRTKRLAKAGAVRSSKTASTSGSAT